MYSNLREVLEAKLQKLNKNSFRKCIIYNKKSNFQKEITPIKQGIYNTHSNSSKREITSKLKIITNINVKNKKKNSSRNYPITQGVVTKDNIKIPLDNKSTFNLIYKDIEESKKMIENELITSKLILNEERKYNSFRNKIISPNSREITLYKTTIAGTTIDTKRMLTTGSSPTNNKKDNNNNNSTQLINLNDNNSLKENSTSKLISSYSNPSQMVTFTNKNCSRRKTFIVPYNTNYNLSEELIHNEIPKIMYNDQEAQKNIFNDEILLIMDSIKNYKVSFFTHKNFIEIFSKQSHRLKVNYNMLIEETIGLMNNTSYIILYDLGNKIQNFIHNPQKKITKDDDKDVYDEDKELIINIKIFNKSADFLKICYDSFELICRLDEHFILPYKVFKKAYQFLHRIRSNLSHLIISTRNILLLYKSNKEISEKYKKEILNHNNKTANINSYHHYKSKSSFTGGIDYTKYKGLAKVKLTYEQEKKKRIKMVFEGFDRGKPRPIINNGFDINSKLIDKLLKYSSEKVRFQVKSERILQRIRKEKEINEIMFNQSD